MIRIRCPGCRREMTLENSRAGQVGRCLQCRQKFRVPVDAPKTEDPALALTKTITKLKALPSRQAARDRRHDTVPDMPERAPQPLFPNAGDASRSSREKQPLAASPRNPSRPARAPEIVELEAVSAEDDKVIDLEALSEDNDEIVELELVPDDEKEPTPSRAPRAKGAAADEDEDDFDSYAATAHVSERRRPVADVHPGADESGGRRIKNKRKAKANRGLNGVHVALIGVGLFVVLAVTGLFFLIQHGFGKAKPPDQGPVLAELEKIHAVIERDTANPDRPVVGIALQYCDVKPQLLRKLTAFPELRKLNLAATTTSSATLQAVEDLTSLQVLNLANTKVNSSGMKFLTKMKDLQELNVAQTMVGDDGLEMLADLKNLKKLNVVGSSASGMSLQAAIPGLEVTR